jgi:hypothetical protein
MKSKWRTKELSETVQRVEKELEVFGGWVGWWE